MELFLPSLLVLLLTFAIVFLVIPRFSPFIIFVLCAIFLVLASYSHFNTYSNEYKNLMFFEYLKSTPLLIILLMTGGILFASSNLLKGFSFRLPTISFADPSLMRISNVKNTRLIPTEKIRELEAQV